MTKLKKALILGGSGMLGQDVTSTFSKKFFVKSTYCLNPTTTDSIFFDAQKNPQLLSKLISEYRPDIIVNCIAIVSVDFCEEDPDICRIVNGNLSERIVKAVKDLGMEDSCCLVHISTDSIYRQNNIENYSFKETDALCPHNMYAKSKIIAERGYSDYKGRLLIIRTAIYGSRSKPNKGLLNWVVSSLRSNNDISGWTNVYFSPISTYRLSLILLDLIQSKASGIFNVGSEDYCTKFEFVQQVINSFNPKHNLISKTYNNMGSETFRPTKTILDVTKVKAYTNHLKPWLVDLEDYLSNNYVAASKLIPYGRQDVTQNDIEAVTTVMKSDFLTQGPAVPQFERTIAEYCGVKYAAALNSATSALHVSCIALGLGKGDWLWTSPISFVATANCGLYCGAKVDFVDIDPKTYNLSALALEEKLIKAEKKGCLPKVVIPVHLGGQSCDMKKIYKLSQKYGFRIIEDASHAIGGRYCEQPIGRCKYSDIAIFSFHAVKIITTAEGGVAVTNNPQLFEKISLLRSHGITRSTDLMIREPDGPWYYEQLDLGYNYRMTDIQAALGNSQIQRLESYIGRRQEIAATYDKAFQGLPVTTPIQHKDCYSSFHLYVVRLQLSNKNISHNKVFRGLRNDGIGVNLHYMPIHTQPYYQKMGFRHNDFPEAMNYYSEAITLPIHPLLDDLQQQTVIDSLKKWL
jgi:UDP-4-amino-4,6-dideoxy-N-acetyl-beta-L-altrosamine transaminase